MRRQRNVWGVAAIAATAAVTLAVSACGSGDSASTSTAAASDAAAPAAQTAPAEASTTQATTEAPAFTGDPVKIWTISPIKSPLGNEPRIEAGAQAAARAINARGGIAGHEVVVEHCNGKGDPNDEVACAREAVKGGALALTGNLVQINAQGVLDTLTQGKTANVASILTVPAEWAAPINFPIDASGLAYTACGAQGVDVAGAKKGVTVALNLAISQAFEKLVAAGAKSTNAPYGGVVSFPPTQADLAPIVQQVQNSGADFVNLALNAPTIVQLISAAEGQGMEWSYCAADGVVSGKELKDVGAKNLYVAASLPPLSSSDQYPELERFVTEMKAEEDAGDKNASTAPGFYNPAALRAWLGMQVIEQVGNKVKGDLNHKTFLAAINKAKVDLGVVPAIDFAKPQPIPAVARLFNPIMMMTKWNADSLQLETVEGAEPYNALQALKTLQGQ